MKTFIKYILQKLMGLNTYLYVFALFVIVKLHWDKKEKDFFHFLKLFGDGGIILDLGANIGATSYHFARKFPKSTIFSFEPLKVNMDILRKIKLKFGLSNIREYEMAVGDKNGTAEMVMPVISDVKMHGLSHIIDEGNNLENDGIRYKVQIICIDDLAALKDPSNRVTAIKIDVENFEYYALKGAEKVIGMHRPVIYCELWENDNRKKCIELLNNLKYSAFILRKNDLVLYDKAKNEKHNFFFLPDK